MSCNVVFQFNFWAIQLQISFAVFFPIHGIQSPFSNLQKSFDLDSVSCDLISETFLSANHGNLRTTLSVSKSNNLYKSATFEMILCSTNISTILSQIHSMSIQSLLTNRIIFSLICAGQFGFLQ